MLKKTKKLLFICLVAFLFVIAWKSPVDIGNARNQSLLEVTFLLDRLFQMERNEMLLGNVTDFHWTPLNDDLYVYSAYWDDRNRTLGSRVRVVTLKKLSKKTLNTGSIHKPLLVGCQMYNEDRSQANPGLLTAQLFDESRYPYVGYFYFCKPLVTPLVPPTHVILYEKNTHNNVSLLVHSLSQEKKNIAIQICLRPIFGNVSVKSIVQFLAHYHTFGIKDFTIYVLSVPQKVRNFLKDIQRLNISLTINIVDWNLVLGSGNVWDNGALVALNDCMYRGMAQFKTSVMVDLDEFIVPVNSSHVTPLMTYTSTLTGNTGALIVMNSFYCMEYAVNGTYEGDKHNSTVASLLRRTNFQIFSWIKRYPSIYPLGERSKLIVENAKLEYVGHHWPNQFVDPNSQFQKLDPGILVMKHYRLCESIVYPKPRIIIGQQKPIIDDSFLRFADEVLSSSIVSFWLNNFSND